MARPWEQEAARPWEAQQPLYPRVISLRRPDTDAAVGAQPYSGTTEAAETPIVAGLPCSIQFTGRLATPLAGTPSDAADRAAWRIMIPAYAAANGLIAERDIIVDDLGKRYQVFAAWWDSLGYNVQVELLEA